MTGDNVDSIRASAGDEARLQQPTDAVPMADMPQTPAAAGEGADKPTEQDAGAANSATPGAASPVAAANAETADAAAAASGDPEPKTTEDSVAEISSKGKDKGAETPASTTKARSDSIMAIGPAQDDIRAVDGSQGDGGPVCNITLLLTSGSRHPYKIDGRYLSRRNVPVPDQTDDGHPDPFSISIYTLKELILREWRSDWEAKPASPSSIRLIHFGKLLDDKEQLKSKRIICVH